MTDKQRYDRELARGAVFNTLGIVGKGLHLLGLFWATWLFGAESLSSFFIALSITELLSGLVLTGYIDATTLFGSRELATPGEDPHPPGLYDVLSNGFVVSIALASLACVLVTLFAPTVAHNLFPQFDHVVEGLILLIWSLLPKSITEIAISATKAHMRMEYDALLKGFVTPAATIALMTLFWATGFGTPGLFLAVLGAETLTAVLSVLVLRRFFAFGPMFSSLRRFRLDKKMLAFAAPQSLSLSFHNYLTHVDVLMLGALGAGELAVSLYGTAARITKELRALRIVFSSALAPVFVRHQEAGDSAAIEETIGKLSRWAGTLAVLVGLILLTLRGDILSLFDERYSQNTLFVVPLIAVAVLNCSFGLAGNALVFSGHSGWALANNFIVAAANTAFNWVFIPSYGLMAAATGTLLAQMISVSLPMLELRRLKGITFRLRPLLPVISGLALGLIMSVAFGDPTRFSWVGPRFCVVMAAIFAFVLGALWTGHPEARGLLARIVRRST